MCSARRSQIAERGLGVGGLECKTPKKGEAVESPEGWRASFLHTGRRLRVWRPAGALALVRAVWLVWLGLVFSVRQGDHFSTLLESLGGALFAEAHQQASQAGASIAGDAAPPATLISDLPKLV